ncbi:hypothetical protein [Paenibacillus lemnae]|uniref:Uncharacterized protein n=1 Tax=Paenibacillus lemnae TaxID=1330551 RepID=A0A848MD46_PAELE|nr:hypothetical protein [Paenibacillus lemnae]NMO98111.1 hypothetical protein [Paenibacillus lemnae]
MEYRELPVPYYKINREFQVLSCSAAAEFIFPSTPSWLNLVDEGSQIKAKNYISSTHTNQRVELILSTMTQPFVPFDVYQRWDQDGSGHLVCISRAHQYTAVVEKLGELQQELKQGVYQREAPKERLGVQAYLNVNRSQNRELCSALETVRDLVDQMYPSLVEINQTDYADIIRRVIDNGLKNNSL